MVDCTTHPHFLHRAREDVVGDGVNQVDDFFSAAEVDYLLSKSSGKYQDSTVGTTYTVDKSVRTSKTAFLELDQNDDIMACLKRKVTTQLQIGEDAAMEQLQFAHYDCGGKYKSHTDSDKDIRRTKTFMAYLKAPVCEGDGEELAECANGGGTYFPVHDTRVCPKAGNVVYWDNLDSAGNVIKESEHEAEAVLCNRCDATKDIVTFWFRE